MSRNSRGWRNERGEHPLKSSEDNNANVVLRTIRNALAHGNVVYLNSEGFETAGNRLVYLAFLCENRGSKGYRAAIFTEESFLGFLKGWIGWIKAFPPERALVFAEAAE